MLLDIVQYLKITAHSPLHNMRFHIQTSSSRSRLLPRRKRQLGVIWGEKAQLRLPPRWTGLKVNSP